MNFRHDSGGRTVLRVALLLGLVLRLVIFSQTVQLGTQITDEQDYVRLANSIVKGNGFAFAPGQPTSMRPPLYPAFVAAVWSVAGAWPLQAVRFFQFGLALLTAWLAFEIGRRAFRPAVGRYAAAIVWLYPSLIFFNFMLLTETLFTLLLTAFVLLAIVLVQQPRAWTALACGLTLGLAALTRSALWPVPLVLCPLLVCLVAAPWRRTIALSALVLAGYVITVAPWAIRNTRLQGVVTIVDTMGGLNLRMGNYAHTPDDRMWAAVALPGALNWSYELKQEHPGEVLTDGQKDKWAQAKAIEYMRDHPATTMRRSLIKFADFWGLEREFAAGDAQGLFLPPRWFALTGSLLIVVVYVLVATLGIAGIWLAAPGYREHILLVFPVLVLVGAHTLAFGHSRYHVPLVPILAVYASALIAAWNSVHWERRRAAAALAAVCVLTLAGIWIRQIAVVDAQRVRALISSVE